MVLNRGLNPLSKYEFSSTVLDYLSLPPKPYTIREIENILKLKKFPTKKSLELTWEEKLVFNILSEKRTKIHFSQALRYIIKKHIIKEISCPDSFYYYYWEEPLRIIKLTFD
jgi:predicted nucleic acid-binding OB-fold protein